MKNTLIILVMWLACDAARGSTIDDFLRWRLLGNVETPDGGTLVRLALESPPECLPWEKLEIIYRSFPRRSKLEPPEIHRKKIKPDQTEITLYSGRPEKIELNARAEKDGRVYYARSFVFAYGESGKNDPESESLDSAPSWPGFSFAHGKGFYRAQAGSELALETDMRPETVKIFENGSLVSTSVANGEGRYAYTPPHDPERLKSFRTDWKSLVFAAELPERQTRFTFYLPVYRAYFGQIDYRGGLVALAASMFAALAWVGWRGRKFPWR
ncbi:MAG: hypothetical protein LBD06_02310 [Candidatus Accumulibacter sp.]|jgi:hypothetical protein|nr:hypothetical protein [Accumulibacter sp.]